MKNIYVLCVFIINTINAYCQPTANSASVPESLTCQTFLVEVDDFNPGNSGANVTWNFVNLPVQPSGTTQIIPTAGAPFSGTFPTANYLLKYEGPFGESYHYFQLNAAKYEKIGMGFPNLGSVNYTQNPRTYVEFPYTFNKVVVDTYKANTDPAATTVTTTYDGYGTLILPFGTYTNVIRQKVVENGVTNYIWFHSNPFFAIMETALEDNSIGLSKATSLSVGDGHAGFDLALYPNPTDGKFRISIENLSDGAHVIICDFSGKALRHLEMTDADLEMDISDFASGLYFVRISDGRKQSVKKVIKK